MGPSPSIFSCFLRGNVESRRQWLHLTPHCQDLIFSHTSTSSMGPTDYVLAILQYQYFLLQHHHIKLKSFWYAFHSTRLSSQRDLRVLASSILIFPGMVHTFHLVVDICEGLVPSHFLTLCSTPRALLSPSSTDFLSGCPLNVKISNFFGLDVSKIWEYRVIRSVCICRFGQRKKRRKAISKTS